MKTSPLKLTLSLVVLFAVPAFAEGDCPVKDGIENPVSSIEAAIRGTDSCYAANKMAEDCAYGSSADVAITNAAIEVCARDYVNISKSDKVILKTLTGKCTEKYANEEGTINLSFAGFCRLNQAQALSSIYKPIEN